MKKCGLVMVFWFVQTLCKVAGVVCVLTFLTCRYYRTTTATCILIDTFRVGIFNVHLDVAVHDGGLLTLSGRALRVGVRHPHPAPVVEAARALLPHQHR